jgi:uncharacterized DUF497 family protein
VIEENDKYSWDTEKRELNIQTRGLDFVILADFIFSDPNVVIRTDERQDYGEDRYLAFALVENARLCLCFTIRDEKIHLITIFKVNRKQWRVNYEKN